MKKNVYFKPCFMSPLTTPMDIDFACLWILKRVQDDTVWYDGYVPPLSCPTRSGIHRKRRHHVLWIVRFAHPLAGARDRLTALPSALVCAVFLLIKIFLI